MAYYRGSFGSLVIKREKCISSIVLTRQSSRIDDVPMTGAKRAFVAFFISAFPVMVA